MLAFSTLKAKRPLLIIEGIWMSWGRGISGCTTLQAKQPDQTAMPACTNTQQGLESSLSPHIASMSNTGVSNPVNLVVCTSCSQIDQGTTRQSSRGLVECLATQPSEGVESTSITSEHTILHTSHTRQQAATFFEEGCEV